MSHCCMSSIISTSCAFADYESAAEILKEVKPYIEEGVGVHVIIKGLRAARDLVSTDFHSQNDAN